MNLYYKSMALVTGKVTWARGRLGAIASDASAGLPRGCCSVGGSQSKVAQPKLQPLQAILVAAGRQHALNDVRQRTAALAAAGIGGGIIVQRILRRQIIGRLNAARVLNY